MPNLEPKTRVRVLAAKPLPSGKSVQLIGIVWYVENDVHVVRIVTPGLYGGGILKLRVNEIEAV